MEQSNIDCPNTPPLALRRPKRNRPPPPAMYVPDESFIAKRYCPAEELEEDEEITRMYGSDTYVPAEELSSDEEEEEELVNKLKAEGHDPDQYEEEESCTDSCTEEWCGSEDEDHDFEPPSTPSDDDDDEEDEEDEEEEEFASEYYEE